MTARPDGALVGYTDKGTFLRIGLGDGRKGLRAVMGEVDRVPEQDGRYDVEAAAFDPVSGKTWLALERVNEIRRYGRRGSFERGVAPRQMSTFPLNEGAEALVRLAEGKFIVLAQARNLSGPNGHTGLLFASDPVESPDEIVRFSFEPPAGYAPSDAAALPDGRIIVLLREIALDGWPPFRSKLVIADPAQIAPGRVWPWRELVDVESIAPRENYEGLAVQSNERGTTLWLISDSNGSNLLTHTRLVRLEGTIDMEPIPGPIDQK